MKITEEMVDVAWEVFFDGYLTRYKGAMRSALEAALAAASTPPAQDCGTVCRASAADGIICPHDSCDIEDGIRKVPPAQEDEPLYAALVANGTMLKKGWFSGQTKEPLPAPEGPEVPDGCDSEGFPGGCERFGHMSETCPNALEDKPVAYMDVHNNWDLYKNKPEQIDVIPLYTRPDDKLRKAAEEVVERFYNGRFGDIMVQRIEKLRAALEGK